MLYAVSSLHCDADVFDGLSVLLTYRSHKVAFLSAQTAMKSIRSSYYVVCGFLSHSPSLTEPWVRRRRGAEMSLRVAALRVTWHFQASDVPSFHSDPIEATMLRVVATISTLTAE